MCVYHCHKCRTAAHNTTQNSSDNFPSYPPDSRHNLDDVYWMGKDIGSVSERIFKIQSTFGEVVDKSRSLSPAECAQDRDVALRVAFPSN